jgi:hypothetical protein
MKFKVGDFVIFETAMHECVLSCKVKCFRLPSIFKVTEILTQECPGGTQYHCNISSNGECVKANEIELLSEDEIDLGALIAAYDSGKNVMGKPKGE